MSYDVSLAADLGGPELVTLNLLDANCTWNVYPMFHAAVGDGPNDWNGKTAAEAAEICGRVLAAFAAEPEKYRAMNPANGWGSFEGAREFIRRIQDACLLAPNAILQVC